jgi:hypothetical protein
MAEFPTRQSVRESLTDEEIAELVKAIPSYERVSPIASLYGEETSPPILHAWANLSEALQAFYPDGTITISTTAIMRRLTDDEMVDRAIAREQSRIYSERAKAEETGK